VNWKCPLLHVIAVAVIGPLCAAGAESRGEGSLEIQSAVLVLEGVQTPGFAKPLDRPNAFNVNRTAAPTGKKNSTVLKVVVRATKPGGCSGKVLIRACK